MADAEADKKVKLANTKKRFKELQELKKKKKSSNEPSSNETRSNSRTPVESLTSSTHSSINNESMQQAFENINITDDKAAKQPQNQENVVQTSYDVPFNYFGSAASKQSSAATFFDSIPDGNTGSVAAPAISNYFSNVQSCSSFENAVHRPRSGSTQSRASRDESPKSGDGYALFSREPHASYVADIQQLGGALHEDLSVDDPELRPNEIREYQEEIRQLRAAKADDLFSQENSRELLDYLDGDGAAHDTDAEMMTIGYEINEASNATMKEVQHSKMESVQQFSNQMAQMIGATSDPTYEYSSSGSITDLEKRNIELAASLDAEISKSARLMLTNNEQKLRISELEKQLKEREQSSEAELSREHSKLKAELEAHVYTVNILHAEKTELATSAAQYEELYKQKYGECEELQARLKASRAKVAELEKDVHKLREERDRNASTEHEYIKSFENLKKDYEELKEQKEEISQDLLEAREKLKNTTEENTRYIQHIHDLTSKLSLADIKIQQLSSGDSAPQIDAQLERFAQDKYNLEKQISSLNESIKTVTRERDESSSQYQLYTQQLNAQLASLSNQVQQLSEENETLKVQELNRVKHLSELERQLQNIQTSYATPKNVDVDLKNELEVQKELAVQLQMEKTKIEEDFTKVSNEKDLLAKELNARNDSISQLESLVEQLRGNQPDSVKLLATMESDKVAAARAVQQNKQLKEQLESMQEVFLKLNNDKVELTETLTKCQHDNKDIFEKLQKTELHLHTLADAIEIKDQELVHLRERSSELEKQFLQQEQLNDRLRHYEMQEHSSHSIQNDLQEARQTVVLLTNEINSLKSAKAENIGVSTEETTQTTLEHSNIDELRKQLQELMARNKELEENLMRKTINETTYKNDTNQNVLPKDDAMRHLEEKVKKTMQEIADLTEEKQRLEHIVLQLQSETETIGEYVALYQHQRMILNQRAVEKDQQLKQLANDRELIKEKLDKLNELIRKLVIEKGAIPLELLQHQADMKNHANFCDEHSRINEEMNKITEGHVGENGTETAQEIIELLGEIKTSNLVQPDENYHHCPYCSGQLITV